MKRPLVVFAFALLGCGPGGPQAHTVRMGAVYMDRGPGCGVAFENLSFQEAMARGQQIGMITLQGTDALDPASKVVVEAEACKVGADFVTFNAGMGTMLQFLAWKASTGDTVAPPSPPTTAAP